MVRNGYAGISIPKSIADEIDKVIESGIGGYSSRSEFMKDATRQLLHKIKETEQN